MSYLASTTKQLSFATPAAAPAGEPLHLEFEERARILSPAVGPGGGGDAVVDNEIRLWDPSAMPLGATSSYREDYTAPSLECGHSIQRQAYVPSPHKLESHTTSGDAYQAPPMPRPIAPAPVQAVTSSHPFTATTTSGDDYRPHDVRRGAALQRQEYVPSPHKLESHTTSGDSYRSITVPSGVTALGVTTQGGGFHCLIPQATSPPALRSAVFTTCRDGQTTLAIKAVAKVGGAYQHLGSFDLEGIAPAPAGVAQVVVSFELRDPSSLHVSAVDRLGSGVNRAVTIRDRLPTPPRGRPSPLD